MSDEYQRVEPTPFDAPSAAPAETAAGGSQQRSDTASRPNWLVPALAGFAVLALVVVFLLPQWVAQKPREAAPAVASSTAERTPSSTTPSAPRSESESDNGSAPSPFADAVAAKARSEAQELLGELIDVQENLIERGAETWAAEAMASIAAEALAGDELYREREFDAAIGHYEQALSDALALEQSLPERFEQQVQATIAAIEALDGESATAALELAVMLEPDNTVIDTLSARLDTLPGVADAVSGSQQAEDERDLESAVEQMQQAQALDTAHEYVQSELARLKLALNDQRFNAAMSEGYAALDDNDFSRAEQRFTRAGKLQPGSAEAAAALQELAVARTAAKLNRLQKSGEDALDNEEFTAAIAAFEEAAKIDASLRFVREGLAFARPRALLDVRLQEILDKPERLVDDAILREARGTLQQTRSLDQLGPRLAEKVSAVEQVLAVASTPMDVSIQSDGLTEVTVYKVARLGMITQRQLSLRPGKYTAVGTRRGYRDVRVEFIVSAGDDAPIYIACSETI